MTEAGEKWVDENNAYRDKYHPGWGSENAYETPERWLRAFCEEVKRRAKSECYGTDSPVYIERLGDALLTLKRELLGD